MTCVFAKSNYKHYLIMDASWPDALTALEEMKTTPTDDAEGPYIHLKLVAKDEGGKIVYTVGKDCRWTYEFTPPLPSGLSFDGWSTGVIRGKTRVPTHAVDYVMAAHYPDGSGMIDAVSIKWTWPIYQKPWQHLYYRTVPHGKYTIVRQGYPVAHLLPVVVGGPAVEWWVKDKIHALPKGLWLARDNGRIYGVPLEVNYKSYSVVISGCNVWSCRDTTLYIRIHRKHRSDVDLLAHVSAAWGTLAADSIHAQDIYDLPKAEQKKLTVVTDLYEHDFNLPENF